MYIIYTWGIWIRTLQKHIFQVMIYVLESMCYLDKYIIEMRFSKFLHSRFLRIPSPNDLSNDK